MIHIPPFILTTGFFIFSIINLTLLGIIGFSLSKYNRRDQQEQQQLHYTLQELRQQLHTLRDEQKDAWHKQQLSYDQHQLKALTTLQDSLQKHMTDTREQLRQTLTHNADVVDKQLKRLTEEVDRRLILISGQVETRLEKGFEKTTALFTNVIKSLASIDQAQKEIIKLSTHVVDLQDVLAGKSSRGVFGEMQLASLVKNMLPQTQYRFQCTLSNGKRVDCLLLLPQPTGNIAVDAKFPLENYRRLQDKTLTATEQKAVQQQFRIDMRHHIRDIAEKYIIPGETASGAMMFIPAEAVFAEIHAHHPGIVEEAQKAKVWLASPTTMMAVLTTALAVLKDVATRQQVHIIQEHLDYLGKDFERFQTRMNQLARHIEQANNDVALVHKSSQKISSRFQKIGNVELDDKTVS